MVGFAWVVVVAGHVLSDLCDSVSAEGEQYVVNADRLGGQG